jgi:predicted ATPase
VINQRLVDYVAMRGGANKLLRFGSKVTPEMQFELVISGLVQGGAFFYDTILKPTDEGLLYVHDEWVSVETNGNDSGIILPNSRVESGLKDDRSELLKKLFEELNSYRVYHFHDTSNDAGMKGLCDLDDNRVLRPQAENLAAYLYYLQEKQSDHFALIQDTVRRIAPFFGDFRLAPQRLNASKIRLEWNEKGHDGYFDATSLSDGTMRFICLATLLLQPELPSVILLDEPELGLHPAAVILLADLLGIASERSQVLVATQSVTLINQLTPEQVWTVNREDDQSVFRKLGPSDYEAWLEDYSLGELWEKNLIQARP